jgi:hypothetical protein
VAPIAPASPFSPVTVFTPELTTKAEIPTDTAQQTRQAASMITISVFFPTITFDI